MRYYLFSPQPGFYMKPVDLVKFQSRQYSLDGRRNRNAVFVLDDSKAIPFFGMNFCPVNLYMKDCGAFRSEEHTLNSSHVSISYAVFCLKKKTTSNIRPKHSEHTIYDVS